MSERRPSLLRVCATCRHLGDRYACGVDPLFTNPRWFHTPVEKRIACENWQPKEEKEVHHEE